MAISMPKHLLHIYCIFTVIMAILCLEPTNINSVFIIFNVCLLAISQFLRQFKINAYNPSNFFARTQLV